MNVALRVSLIRPGAEFFGVATTKAQWEKTTGKGRIIWNGPGKKPTWSEILAAADLETAEIARQEALASLDQSDKAIARIAEDVIAMLDGAGLVDVTTLAPEAQAILAKRKADREALK